MMRARDESKDTFLLLSLDIETYMIYLRKLFDSDEPIKYICKYKFFFIIDNMIFKCIEIKLPIPHNGAQQFVPTLTKTFF